MHTDYRSPAPMALTFDDGPDPVWTTLVLNALSSAGAPATFFVIAPRAARHPSLISSMRKGGHDIALHCVEHPRLHKLKTIVEPDYRLDLFEDPV